MIYSVRHVTIFGYEPAVRESVMEVRMQPRSEGRQRCLNFHLSVNPIANVMSYRDFMGNTVHHFNIAGSHAQVKLTAQGVVEVESRNLPFAGAAGDWDELDALIAGEDHWEMMLPSEFTSPTDELQKLAKEIGCERRGNLFEFLTELNQSMFQKFAYAPKSTKVDSPIDEALANRKGVCQDFAHIMIALLRGLKVPARYVSGYLFHEPKSNDRSSDGASHAWVEVLVPKLGWVGFDPTNNLLADDRHLRVAIGRDYADVPPTRGVYKGDATSELSVSVTVSPSNRPLPEELMPSLVLQPRILPSRNSARIDQARQQQQQQQ
ncbi:MAG TPA: transglutaminase family protein [Terriglobales bacterium]|nr:transglutaminase family protein [Terriglobales bacterium]